MGVGTSEQLADEQARQGKRNLTVIANDIALPGIGKLMSSGAVTKSIASHIGLAKRIARELRDGMLVNLGIGIPTLVSKFVPTSGSPNVRERARVRGTGSASPQRVD